MSLCCLIYLYQILFDPNLTHYTLCPRDVLYLHSYYRLVTNTLFHGGLMHIGMNMSATLAIGNTLERRFGTLKYGLTVSWGILLTSGVYVLTAWALSVVAGASSNDGLMYSHSVGFSGVIFQLSVIEAHLSPESSRSVFGFFRVPAWGYPWALLIAIQVIMPHISFMGHLAGIIVGTLQVYGYLDCFFPKNEFLRGMEEDNAQ
eukprot:CAMPEP_0172499100 /NCGR_PEP_ID=MMETSP1066-20121228/122016_1 /TAXON_ID=671091 /ORGANISM="Coscinodiscus wailesii, Strain CCMP2513" /LENGTH=202 /DNA_ID=CAMNT_0013272659 /DNA_START=180 /DNA_END=785 /DNA_ORIENTATION=-